MEIYHIPVLPNETIKLLNIKEGSVVVDCTVGEGGHSALILRIIGKSGFLIGIDKDTDALKKANERLSSISKNFVLVHGNFANIKEILAEKNIKEVDAALADLGLSSLQLQFGERGFSFMNEGPLDMRMDKSKGITAYAIVNGFDESNLSDIFYFYGEERRARAIASAIVRYRKTKKIETTTELANIVDKIYGGRHGRINPATKVFQALRIAVNGELEDLKKFLSDIPDVLITSGRVGVISYHSLEDRLVKNAFRSDPRLKRINKKVIRPEADEIERNRRSRSAKLRVAEKI